MATLIASGVASEFHSQSQGCCISVCPELNCISGYQLTHRIRNPGGNQMVPREVHGQEGISKCEVIKAPKS